MFVSESMLSQFKYYLEAEEKSEHTISKYCRDVHRFILYGSDSSLRDRRFHAASLRYGPSSDPGQERKEMH